MKKEKYLATIKHDNGITKIQVVSLNGEASAIQQILTVEKLPKCALIKMKKITSKS